MSKMPDDGNTIAADTETISELVMKAKNALIDSNTILHKVNETNYNKGGKYLLFLELPDGRDRVRYTTHRLTYFFYLL
jgi:hypothetical protein